MIPEISSGEAEEIGISIEVSAIVILRNELLSEQTGEVTILEGKVLLGDGANSSRLIGTTSCGIL